MADMTPDPEQTTADIVASYDRARDAADAVIDRLSMEDVGTAWVGEQASLRRVLVGMVEETEGPPA